MRENWKTPHVSPNNCRNYWRVHAEKFDDIAKYPFKKNNLSSHLVAEKQNAGCIKIDRDKFKLII